jgi:hypothetical protein
MDAAMHGKILASVHDRIPMPTADDQRAVQLANTRADVKVWEILHVAQAEMVEGQKKVLPGVRLRELLMAGDRAIPALNVPPPTASWGDFV